MSAQSVANVAAKAGKPMFVARDELPSPERELPGGGGHCGIFGTNRDKAGSESKPDWKARLSKLGAECTLVDTSEPGE